MNLAPLTIFAGANSSGKSSFIQSILLVAQTLASKVSSRSVVLNGALASLGQFDDLRSNDSESDQIVIQFTYKPVSDVDRTVGHSLAVGQRPVGYYGLSSNRLREISCELAFDADLSSSQRDLFQIQPRLFASQLSSISRDEDNLDQIAEISVRHSSKALSEVDAVKTTDEIDDRLRASLTYDIDIDEASMNEVREDFRTAKPIGCTLRHFLPDTMIYEINTVHENANAIYMALIEDGRRLADFNLNLSRDLSLTEELITLLREVLRDTIDFDNVFNEYDYQQSLFDSDVKAMPFRIWHRRIRALPQDTRIKVQQTLREADDLFNRIIDVLERTTTSVQSHAFVQAKPPRQITESAVYLDNFFASSLKYLGPLRDAPKPLYPLAPAVDPYDVGLRGEHTASILDLHKDKQVRYIPSSHFTSATIDRKITTRTLESAVIDWLQYLGVASSVQSRDQGKLGHELKVGLGASKSMHDLTHVGVGVSQVLPILVMCLLAGPDSTLVFEQPELHLHPKVQTLLGDFFLSMALCNKQCIVETHSEYIIDRLRFRIAAASREGELRSQTKIFFVDKPLLSSKFREVVINEYGAIMEWPEGFFDQSQKQAEEILRAAVIKRTVNRRKSDE